MKNIARTSLTAIISGNLVILNPETMTVNIKGIDFEKYYPKGYEANANLIIQNKSVFLGDIFPQIAEWLEKILKNNS